MKTPANWMTLGALGFEFALCVVVGVLLGVELDEWQNIQPFGVLLGTLSGIAAALHRLFRYLALLKGIDHRGEQNRD